MGLDVYLYRYINRKDTEERESKYHDYSNKLWEEAGSYDSVTDEVKDEIREKCKVFAESLGLDEWGDDKLTKFKVEENSKLYPDHLFKLGYFRSSYNSGGINRILSNMGLPTLGEIMGADEEYLFQPDWEKALDNVESVISQLKEKGAYRVEAISGNWFRDNGIKSESDALEAFLKEKEGNGNGFNYSNAMGHFYLQEPVKVLAMIPGKQTILGERDCTYVVTESDNQWYIQALEVVKETIEYVIGTEMKEQYYLHWSG